MGPRIDFWRGVGVVAVALSGAAAGAESMDLNGYHPGMSRTAAKQRGYTDCEQPRPSEAITCTATAAGSTWQGLPIERVGLEFGPPKFDRVRSVTFRSEARESVMHAALRKAYGAPFAQRRGMVYVGSNDVLASTSGLPMVGSRLTLTHSPGAFARQQQRNTQAQRLKDF